MFDEARRGSHRLCRLEKRESRKCTYTANARNMMQTVYDTELWTMRKPLQQLPPPPPRTMQQEKGEQQQGGSTPALGGQSPSARR